MKNFSRWVQNYLLYVFPVVVVTVIWSVLTNNQEGGPFLLRALWEVCSWSLIVWFVLLFIFMWMLVFHAETREQVIRRIANIKERDEREEIVTGKASRVTFVSSLSLLILLLFLSAFTLQLKKLPPEQVVNDKHGLIALGFDFHFLDDAVKITNDQGLVIEKKDIPLSKSAILLLAIFWQLASFRMYSRRLLHETD
jgi:hypothetical protein